MRLPSAAFLALVFLTSATAVAQVKSATPIGTVTVALPTVTTATPSALQLKAGSAGVTVRVDGTGLDNIMSAYIEHNGVQVTEVSAAVQLVSAAQINVVLTPQAGARPRAGALLKLKPVPGTGGMVAPPPIDTKVAIEILGALVISEAELFATPINTVLAGVVTMFNSCGATDDERKFSITLPSVPYSATGAVPRLEYSPTLAERGVFLERHSLTPNDPFLNPQQLLDIGKSGHPSPVPHTLTGVRMCLDPTPGVGNWKFVNAGALQILVRVSYAAVNFTARGMPADPSGAISGLNVGILWGHTIVDTELADRQYLQPLFDVSLPLQVASGTITYGPSSVTLRGQAGWKSTFFGPDAVRSLLENFAFNRMKQIETEIRDAFEAGATRSKISAAILAAVKSKVTLASVAGVSPKPNSMWDVYYR